MKKIVDGKKKIYAGIGVVVIVIALMIAYMVNENKEKLFIKAEVVSVELGEEVSVHPTSYLADDMSTENINNTTLSSDLLTDTDKYVVDEEEQTVKSKDKDYLNVGEYKITLSLHKEVKDITIQVVDTTSPTFKDINKEIKVEQNAEDVEFVKYFIAEDLSEVTITVDDTTVDLTTVGEYEVEVTATDAYNNKTTETIKVIVVDADKVNEVTETIDGEKPLSAETKQKKEEQAQQQQQQSTGTNSGGTSGGGNSTGGTTGNGGGGQTSQPSQPEQPIYRTDISNSYVARINAYREQNGVPALPVTAEAQAEANQRAMEMVNNYGHNASSGFTENIGMGTAGVDFVTAWQGSPNHNGTMLREDDYQGMAVAVVEYNGRWYAVVSFRTKW